MLKKNLSNLNSFYRDEPIHFEDNGFDILIVEEVPFYLNSMSALKETLKYKYKARFDGGKKWYIGKEGIKILSTNIIKFKPTRSFDELKARLKELIYMIKDVELQNATINIINDLPEYPIYPASMHRHHNYQHGLLEHSIQVVEHALAAVKLEGLDTILDTDILIVGGLLHDIGKCHSYVVTKNENLPSDTMIEQDHIFHGGYLIGERFHASPEIVQKVLHIIASHHMQTSWGAAVTPKTMEAWLISICDNLSAKIGG